MRIIDLHCYPGTKEWIACQGPYVEALAKYWKRDWSGKTEDEVIREFTEAGVDACLVALDLETKEMAKVKLPERLLILDDLPLSNFGKVSKKRLSELASARAIARTKPVRA